MDVWRLIAQTTNILKCTKSFRGEGSQIISPTDLGQNILEAALSGLPVRLPRNMHRRLGRRLMPSEGGRNGQVQGVITQVRSLSFTFYQTTQASIRMMRLTLAFNFQGRECHANFEYSTYEYRFDQEAFCAFVGARGAGLTTNAVVEELD